MAGQETFRKLYPPPQCFFIFVLGPANFCLRIAPIQLNEGRQMELKAAALCNVCIFFSFAGWKMMYRSGGVLCVCVVCLNASMAQKWRSNNNHVASCKISRLNPVVCVPLSLIYFGLSKKYLGVCLVLCYIDSAWKQVDGLDFKKYIQSWCVQMTNRGREKKDFSYFFTRDLPKKPHRTSVFLKGGTDGGVVGG